MKSEKVIDQILYGDGVYVSALPILIITSIFEVFNNLVTRFIRKFDRYK